MFWFDYFFKAAYHKLSDERLLFKYAPPISVPSKTIQSNERPVSNKRPHEIPILKFQF